MLQTLIVFFYLFFFCYAPSLNHSGSSIGPPTENNPTNISVNLREEGPDVISLPLSHWPLLGRRKGGLVFSSSTWRREKPVRIHKLGRHGALVAHISGPWPREGRTIQCDYISCVMAQLKTSTTEHVLSMCVVLSHTCLFSFSLILSCSPVFHLLITLFVFMSAFSPLLFAGLPVLPGLIAAPMACFLWVTPLWLRHSRTFAGDEHIITQLPLSLKRYLKNIHTWSNALLFLLSYG